MWCSQIAYRKRLVQQAARRGKLCRDIIGSTTLGLKGLDHLVARLAPLRRPAPKTLATRAIAVGLKPDLPTGIRGRMINAYQDARKPCTLSKSTT